MLPDLALLRIASLRVRRPEMCKNLKKIKIFAFFLFFYVCVLF